jgi:hypothetical protein
MAQTVATMASVLKDVWTSDRVQKQFEDKNQPLGRIESLKGSMIGQQAQVPILAGRSGGYTSVGSAGGSLNPAGQQPLAQATFTLPYHWFQIAIDAAALLQSGDKNTSVIKAKDLEIEQGIENTKHQMTRQAVTNGDGIVASCASGGASTTVQLTPQASEGNTTYGYSAVARNWIFPGAVVDIGTTADTDALATGVTVTAVNGSATAPTFTTGTSVTTTAGTHFVYIANPNSTTLANTEMNGLRQIVNSTGALGGLNPATAGQEYWQAAARDTTTTTLSLDLIVGLQRSIKQATGAIHQAIWTSFKQEAAFYSLLQNQVRFANDSSLSAGNVSSPTFNGMQVEAFADILDTDLYCLTLSDLLKVTGSQDKPQWASDLQGATTGQLWSAGTTSFVDGLVYSLQLGCQRRNSHAAATALI